LSVAALRFARRALTATWWRPAAPALPAAASPPGRASPAGVALGAGAASRAARSSLEHRFTARGEDCLEGLDAVVGCLEKEIVNSGLGLFQLSDQRLGVAAGRHRSAELRRDPVPARPAQDHELTLLGGLDEVLRPVAAALASAAAGCWPCLRLEVLRCFHEIDEIDVAVYESIELDSSAGPRRAPKRLYKIREGVGI
jgi:hypothetical protein